MQNNYEGKRGTALIEIGTAELPPRFFYEAVSQLKVLAEKKLKAHRLVFEKTTTCGTPRRLVLEISGLISHQSDIEKEVRGPAQSTAFDQQGKPTQALLGFLKSQNLSLPGVKVKEFSGKPYAVGLVQQKGKPTLEILAFLFPEIIAELAFPKSMRWDGNLTFGRPIRWILALYEDSLVPFQLENLKSGKLSYGHRFLSRGPLPIQHPSQYRNILGENYVIVDHEARKEKIRSQVDLLAQSKGGCAYRADPLMDEVTLLLEYPTAFLGSFEEAFLLLPQDVLITVMQHHQRYFPLVTSQGKLLHYFAAVRNGNEEGLEEVRFGNEQVLRARFKDASYFFESDKKTKLIDRLSVLDKLVFQKDLGTIRQKMNRIHGLVDYLAKKDNFGHEINLKALKQAVDLCKCDLATQMVFELPELQGVMGREYARIEGYSEEVSQAVLDHYLPRFQGDDLPQTMLGVLIGIADRMDTLAGCIAVKLKPTGSSDPLGLRRTASALVQLLLEKKVNVNLEEFIETAMEEYERQLPHFKEGSIRNPMEEIRAFILERAEAFWKGEEIRYDLIRAFSGILLKKPHSAFLRAQFLENFRQREKERFVPFVLAWVRVFNILKSKEAKEILNSMLQKGQIPFPEKGSENEEKKLLELLTKSKPSLQELLFSGNIQGAWNLLSEFQAPINLFFDKVLVMAPEEDLRRSRLVLLWNLQNLMMEAFGDLAQIVLN